MQRSERTRALIVESHTDLLRQGVLRPTAAQIAEHAGVSRRTLWSNFHDMENLLQNTVEHWFSLDDALRVEIDLTLPLDQRIEEFCTERARRLVNISPAARAAVLAEHYSPTLRESRQRHIQRVRDDLTNTFSAEIEGADDPDRLLDSLTAITSWNAWSLLFDDHGRNATQCRAAMALALRALLAPRTANGADSS